MKPNHNKKGTILIISLWILAILSILAVGIGFRVSLETRLSKYNLDKLKALYLAKAGTVRIRERISTSTNPYDSLYECGITLSQEEKNEPEKYNAIFNAVLDEGSYSLSLTDEKRKININTATREILERLPGITPEMVSSIIDWRDENLTPEPGGGEDDDYYKHLEHPYQCKNGPFSAIEELLLVKGVTVEFFDQVKNYITINGDGKVNINTAPKEALVATGMTDELANKIINFRNGPDRLPETADDNIFLDVNLDNPSSSIYSQLTDDEKVLIGKIKNYFTIKSVYFRIESKGRLERSRIEKTITYIGTKDAGGITLVSYRER